MDKLVTLEQIYYRKSMAWHNIPKIKHWKEEDNEENDWSQTSL